MKRLKQLFAVCILLSLLGLCGCQTQDVNNERTTTVVISIESDGIYGVVFEYCIDRIRLGGQMLSKDPDMTAPLPQDKGYASFSEKGFRTPEELESGIFGILVWVVLDNGEQIPVEYLWEWQAAYGGEYNFSLSGNKNDGFTFAPTDENVEYSIMPWSELPSDLIS